MTPTNTGIAKLDITDARRPLLEHDRSDRASNHTGGSGSFFEQVADGIAERHRVRMKREVVRYVSFICAILSW